jgi:hypothetical protein
LDTVCERPNQMRTMARERGSKANAPQANAVRGGLLPGEPATHFVMPAIYSVLVRDSGKANGRAPLGHCDSWAHRQTAAVGPNVRGAGARVRRGISPSDPTVGPDRLDQLVLW